MRRIRDNREYQEIYRRGRSTADKNMVLYVLMTERSSDIALGVSASKKYGNSVQRHRFKRRIKEIVRLSGRKLKSGTSFVVIARIGAADNYHELERSFLKLADRLKAISRE